jgi:sulfur carrier protein
MKLSVNGESVEVAATTIAALLAELAYDGKVATALNEKFVPASHRDTAILQAGDRVEILAPMQGG